MSEFGKELTKPLPAFGYENARQFYGWMFPNVHPDVIDELSEGQLKSIYEILVEHARARFDSEKDFRRKNLVKMPFDITRRWFSGDSIDEIARAKGKQDGSIRIPLMEHARRLGEVENLYDLIDESDERAAELVEALLSDTEKMISEMLQEEALAKPEPEPIADPAEEIVDIPVMPSCEEAAQIAVQKTIEITEVEEPEPEKPVVELVEPEQANDFIEPELMDPKQLERLIDEFPMLRDMSPEAVAEVARNLRLG